MWRAGTDDIQSDEQHETSTQKMWKAYLRYLEECKAKNIYPNTFEFWLSEQPKKVV